jgi:hypothetical protein
LKTGCFLDFPTPKNDFLCGGKIATKYTKYTKKTIRRDGANNSSVYVRISSRVLRGTIEKMKKFLKLCVLCALCGEKAF